MGGSKINNINIRVKGTKVNLNKKTLKGTTIDKNTPVFIKKHDKNNDGVISEKESLEILKDLKKASGNNILSAKEFKKAKLGTNEDFNKIGSSVNKKAGKSTVKNKDGSTTTTVRNEDGSITRTTVKNKNKFVATYDENGNITSKQTISPKGSEATVYKYDENGNLISANSVSRNSKKQIKGQSSTVYTYDEAGNRIRSKRTDFNSKGKNIRTTDTKIENNTAGQPVKTTTAITNAKGEVISTASNEYQYKDGKLSSIISKNANKDSTVISTKNYAADGKTVLNVTQDVKNKDGSTAHTEQTHNENGKIVEKHTVKKDATGYVISDISTKNEYQKDGKTIKTSVTEGTKNGKPYSENIQFDENGEMQTIDKVSYKRGGKVAEHYDGENLKNRYGHIPSKTITYEEDGKTIKDITINKFDKDGVLIGSEIFDKDGKVIDTHDFSKIDNKFDTAYQKGRGDCYLLAGVNALSDSAGGQEALKDTITTGKDPKTGETTYTVHFPGAAKTREMLLKQGVPEEEIDIKDSYTYTESEIHERAKLAGKKYSAGDKDVLLLEVAYEDLRNDGKDDIEDFKKANPKLGPTYKYAAQMHMVGLDDKNTDNLNGGLASDAIFMLTGEDSEKYSKNSNVDNAPVCSIDSDLNMTVTGKQYQISAEENAKIDNMLNKIDQDCKDGKLDNYAGTVGLRVSSQTVNGKVISGAGHAFSITKVEGDKVYLANPWDPTKEIVMTRDEIKGAAHRITLTNLSDGSSTEVGGEKPPAVPGNNGGNSGQVSNTPQAGASFTVPKGKGYRTLLTEALKAQGIEPTPENIQKASEQFKAANQGAVHVYNGSNSQYKGNEYLLMGATVTIPKFEM